MNSHLFYSGTSRFLRQVILASSTIPYKENLHKVKRETNSKTSTTSISKLYLLAQLVNENLKVHISNLKYSKSLNTESVCN